MTGHQATRPVTRDAPAMLVGVVIGFVAALVLIGMAVLLNLDTVRNLVLMWFLLDQW
jgi:uncharacterized protein (DUF983 family)